MVYIVFGSWIAGVILLYIAQKFPSKWARIVLRIFGFLLILWIFIAYFININSDPVACAMDVKICPDGSAVGRVAPDCNFEPCPTKKSAWQEAVRAVENCEVEQVFQAHSREIGIIYKDGRELRAVEPNIDDIIDVAVKAEPDCGKIIMATE